MTVILESIIDCDPDMQIDMIAGSVIQTCSNHLMCQFAILEFHACCVHGNPSILAREWLYMITNTNRQ